MSSRNISDLLPAVASMANAMLADCKRQGLDVVISCTYRSNEDQAALYSQGRTTAGRIVTNAKAGQSKHNTKQAIDIYPIINGKLAGVDCDAGRMAWKRLGSIGKEAGFIWGGDWAMRDYPHFESK